MLTACSDSWEEHERARSRPTHRRRPGRRCSGPPHNQTPPRRIGAFSPPVRSAWRPSASPRLVVSREESPAPTPTVDANAAEPVEAVARTLLPSVVFIRQGRGPVGRDLRRDGLILTAAHVVGEAEGGPVRLADGRRETGKVLGRDPTRDIAVAKSPSGPSRCQARPRGSRARRTARRRDRQSLRPQDSVTLGRGQWPRPDAADGARRCPMRSQTDAPLNPGNSGGPRRPLRRVIGINVAVRETQAVLPSPCPLTLPCRRSQDCSGGQEPAPVAFLGVTGTDPSTGRGRRPRHRRGSRLAGGAKAGIEEGDLIVACRKR